MFRLSERGGVGLWCDERGIGLGSIALVDAVNAAGRRAYRTRPADEIARTLAVAYGPFSADDLARRLSGLYAAERALEAGNATLAAIATVLLKLPPLSPEAMAKLANDPTLKKYSVDQPRDARGLWTDSGGGPTRIAANDTGVMSDTGGYLPAAVSVLPPGTGEVREYSPEDAAKLPPPPGSKYAQ